MSIEAHKCNVEGCKGYVTFENADFDFKDIPLDKKSGYLAFSTPNCNECGKEFVVVPHYIVIDVIDKEAGDFEELESACWTSVEKRQREIKFERETDPQKRIEMYIRKCGYSYSLKNVLDEYEKFKQQYYVSHSMKDIINHLEPEIIALIDSH